MQESSSDICALNRCSDCSRIKAGSAAGTHWLRNAKRYLITIRVVLGRFRSTFRMWSALSCKLSIAERKKEHHWVITASPAHHWVPMQSVHGMVPSKTLKHAASTAQGSACFLDSPAACQRLQVLCVMPLQLRTQNMEKLTAGSFLAWEHWMSSPSIALA